MPDSANHISLVECMGNIYFIQIKDGVFIPTLRLLHKCKKRGTSWITGGGGGGGGAE